MVRMKDIADAVGVSRSTVSLVLNRREVPGVRIPDQTRQRILDTAAEMGYRRNEIARSMITGESRVLGFLVSEPQAEYASRLMVGAMEAAEAAGYVLQVFRFSERAVDRELIRRCVEWRLAGLMVLFVNEQMVDYLLEEMGRYRIPVAILGSGFPHECGLRVVFDNYQGCRLALEHLAELGHRRIHFLIGDPAEHKSRIREEAFRRAMASLDLPCGDGCVHRQPTHWTVDDADALLADLEEFTPSTRPTALFCESDITAASVLRAARRQGWPVPAELSVVGYSNSAAAALVDPPLTSVSQPFEEMGAVAVRHLIERSTEKAQEKAAKPDGSTVILANQLAIRDSTAQPPEMG